MVCARKHMSAYMFSFCPVFKGKNVIGGSRGFADTVWVHDAIVSFERGTYLPTSSTTGAGHSKNVFSTPAGFSSERTGEKVTFLSRAVITLSVSERNTQRWESD